MGVDVTAAVEDTLGPIEESDGLSARDWFRDLGNMLKAFIGLNVMYTAFAFTKAGIIRGTVGLVAILYLTEYCCLQLIKVKNLMPDAREPGKYITYGDVARFALGETAQQLVNFFLLITQFGFCVGYLIFLSQTVHDVVSSSAPVWSFVLLPLPVLGVLAMLRSIRSLAVFSNISNLALLIGCLSVATYVLVNFEYQPVHPSIFAFPLFIGQMTAALEGITLVIPVESSMKRPLYFPVILRVALSVMGFVLIVVGVLGMMTFGENTRSIILLNIQGSNLVVAVKVILCLGILFTYPLQLVPIVQVLETWLQGRSVSQVQVQAHDIGGASFEAQDRADVEDEWNEADDGVITHSPRSSLLTPNGSGGGDLNVDGIPSSGATDLNIPACSRPPAPKRHFVRGWRSILGRAMIVLSTAIVAIFAGRSFGVFLSLVGSLGAASLAFTIPPLIYMEKFRTDMNSTEIGWNYAIVGFGAMSAVVGTVISVMEIAYGEQEGAE